MAGLQKLAAGFNLEASPSGDGGAATSAQLRRPTALAVSGDLLFIGELLLRSTVKAAASY